MRFRKEYIILALIIIALVLYLFFRKQDKIHYRLPDLAKVPASRITTIEIIRPGDSITLTKDGEDWVISPQGYKVDSQDINNMLDFIEQPVITVMVSDSKNFTRYGLDKESRVTIKALSNEELKREIELGNPTSSRRHTFVKLTNDHRVYHARDNQRDLFNQNMDELRDKKVLAFNREEIKEIHLTKGPQSIIVLTPVPAQPEESGNGGKDTEGRVTAEDKVQWQTSQGKKVDVSLTDQLLSNLSGLTCKAFLYDTQKDDMSDPVCTVFLKGEKEYTLSIFPEIDDPEGYPAVSSAKDSPFVLRSWIAEKIIEAPDNILKKPEDSGD